MTIQPCSMVDWATSGRLGTFFGTFYRRCPRKGENSLSWRWVVKRLWQGGMSALRGRYLTEWWVNGIDPPSRTARRLIRRASHRNAASVPETDAHSLCRNAADRGRRRGDIYLDRSSRRPGLRLDAGHGSSRSHGAAHEGAAVAGASVLRADRHSVGGGGDAGNAARHGDLADEHRGAVGLD